MKIDGSTSLWLVAATVPGATGVFNALGIDYTSPGERSIAEAAGLEGIDAHAALTQLRQLPGPDGKPTWLDRSLTELIQHLVNQHHRFTRDELARVAEQFAEICSAPSADDAMKSIREEFKTLSNDLLPHMHKEDDELFPLIVRMEASWQTDEPAPSSLEGIVTQPIKELLVEHGTISASLRRLREKRIAAAESADLPPRCREALGAAAKLEGRLREYMFLENCILFPRALALQDSLYALK